MLSKILRGIGILLTRSIVGLLGGFQIEGLENLPATGGVIIAPNHVSLADPPVVGTALGRPARFMGSSELFRNPILAAICRVLGGFPVEQDSPDRSALRQAIGLLQTGKTLVVFPEGHISTTGVMRPLQAGTIMMAARANVPIVPAGIVGTAQMMPAGGFRFRHANQRIRVRFGRPIWPDDLTGGLKGRAGIEHGLGILAKSIGDLISCAEEESGLCHNSQELTGCTPEGDKT